MPKKSNHTSNFGFESMPMRAQQDVGRFDVPMNQIQGMKELQPHENIMTDLPCAMNIQHALLLQNVLQTPFLHEFSHQVPSRKTANKPNLQIKIEVLGGDCVGILSLPNMAKVVLYTAFAIPAEKRLCCCSA